MSDIVLPVMPGMGWPVLKVPEYSTLSQRAASGKTRRAAGALTPLFTFTLIMNLLRQTSGFTEWVQLCGMFGARMGAYDSFLYADPSDYTVTDQSFGTGDGADTTFQLKRSYGAGGFTADVAVNNVTAITNVKVNGVAIVAGPGAGKYQVNSTGLVTFGTAPAASATITWTGTYYYRCRFVNDNIDFSEFMYQLWKLDELAFVGSPKNKVLGS